jgi:nucleoside-diphosphate-sugar epimerase
VKIGIIGATGKAGRTLVAEATARGHETTALVRDAGKAVQVLGEHVPALPHHHRNPGGGDPRRDRAACPSTDPVHRRRPLSTTRLAK